MESIFTRTMRTLQADEAIDSGMLLPGVNNVSALRHSRAQRFRPRKRRTSKQILGRKESTVSNSISPRDAATLLHTPGNPSKSSLCPSPTLPASKLGDLSARDSAEEPRFTFLQGRMKEHTRDLFEKYWAWDPKPSPSRRKLIARELGEPTKHITVSCTLL